MSEFLDDLQKSLGMFQEAMTQSAVKKAVADATDQAQRINITTTNELEKRQAMFGLSNQLAQQFLAAGLSPQQAAQGASLFQPQRAESAEQAFSQGDVGLAHRMVGFRDYANQIEQAPKQQFAIAQQEAQFEQQNKLQEAQFRQQRAMQREARSSQKGSLEQEKADLKDAITVKKENRKERRELDKAEQGLIAQKQSLEKARTQFNEYSKGSYLGGTGPVATGFGLKKFTDQETESLDTAFKNISFDTLIKSFQGMSRAVDSDSERKFFEATQPSVTLDDATNQKLLDDKLNAVNSLLEKTQKAKQNFDKYGSFQEPFPREVYNPVTKQKATVYSQEQLSAAQSEGFK